MSDGPETTTLTPDGQDARAPNLPILLLVCAFLVVLLRCAWVAEDAYITFRTVDNFINGLGLTWNVPQRVQAYTHPLWMLVVSAAYFFTREFFLTAIVLSVVCSLGAVALLVTKIANSAASAIPAIFLLIFSKAFVDFSTSGLENPLTHLCLAAFCWTYFDSRPGRPHMFRLSLIAAACILNRLDTILLLLPAVMAAWWWSPKIKGLMLGLLGFVPVAVWEAFSLFYYGFPFPNTAYAKLNSGIPFAERFEQGLYYLLNSLNLDPLTLIATVGTCVAVVLLRRGRLAPIVAGVILYLTYVVSIGGDHMSGRYLTGPLFLAAVMLSRFEMPSFQPALVLGGMIALIGFSPKTPTVMSNAAFAIRGEEKHFMDLRGIADERAVYYRVAGLLRVKRNAATPRHKWVYDGRKARWWRDYVPKWKAIGYRGLNSGPEVWIVDRLALTDPLLARLPAKRDPLWRVGHYERVIPYGYWETLRDGEDQLEDRDLAAYFEKLRLITEGPLWDRRRLDEIWRFNRGDYEHLIDFDTYRYPGMIKITLSEFGDAKAPGTPFWQQGNQRLFNSGIEIDMEGLQRAARIELSLHRDDTYDVVYFRDGRSVARQRLFPKLVPAHGLSMHLVDAPKKAIEEGFDHVRVFPVRGQDFNIGHFRIVEQESHVEGIRKR